MCVSIQGTDMSSLQQREKKDSPSAKVMVCSLLSTEENQAEYLQVE